MEWVQSKQEKWCIQSIKCFQMAMARNYSPRKMDDLRWFETQNDQNWLWQVQSRTENAAIPKSLIILGPVDKLPSGKRFHNYEKSPFFHLVNQLWKTTGPWLPASYFDISPEGMSNFTKPTRNHFDHFPNENLLVESTSRKIPADFSGFRWDEIGGIGARREIGQQLTWLIAR